jgi:hypothetical protein
MNKEKIYISGRISGIENEAEKLFNEAEIYLKKEYPKAEIFNPMKEFPFVKGKTWEQYMIDDIKLLFNCTTIFMLTNWNYSRGARIEHNIAINTGKRIIFQF